MLSEMTGKENQVPYNFKYKWNLKQTNKQKNRNKLIDGENKLMADRKGVGELNENGEGIKKHKLWSI